MSIDTLRIEHAVREILYAIGENPQRDGLLGTPKRVARAYKEMFSGLATEPLDVLGTVFNENYRDIVIVRNIEVSSKASNGTKFTKRWRQGKMNSSQKNCDASLVLNCDMISPWSLIRTVVGPRYFLMTIAIVLLAIAAFVHMMIPWFLSKVIDEGLMKLDRSSLVYWGTALAAISIMNPIAYMLGYRIMALLEAYSRRQVNYTINSRVSFPGATAQVRNTGETINVVTSDNAVLASVFSTIGHGLMNLIAFALGITLVWNINMLLGISIAIGVIATTAIAGPLLGSLEKRGANYRGTLASTTDFAVDTIRGLRILRGIGGERKFLDRYKKQSGDLLKDSYRLSNQSSWIHALQQNIPLAYMVAVIWLGARLALNGDITVGELGAAFGYATGLVMYSGSLLGIAHSIVSIRVAASRISRHLSSDISTNTETEVPEQSAEKRIVLENGKLTVIVPSRMSYAKRVFEGFVKSEKSLETLMVSEADYIFSGTLAEALNITNETLDASLAVVNGKDIQSSIESASDKFVHDKGLNLSGGQRQRLVLARAIARQAETLLLCDPSSAVDAVTELAIARYIKEKRLKKTTIVASRSLIWRSCADSVIYLSDSNDDTECASRLIIKHGTESV